MPFYKGSAVDEWYIVEVDYLYMLIDLVETCGAYTRWGVLTLKCNSNFGYKSVSHGVRLQLTGVAYAAILWHWYCGELCRKCD